MKEEFQKLVCDIIDKSGVEIDTEERQKIIDEAIKLHWSISPRP